MATNAHLNTKGAVARVLSVGAALAALTLPLLAASAAAQHTQPNWRTGLDADELDLIGYAGNVPDSTKPKLTAFFPRESYASGSNARLVVTDDADDVTLQLFRSGAETTWTLASDRMFGKAVTAPTPVGSVHGRRVVRIDLAGWPSGVYFARLTAPGKRVGYAPFVLRPRKLGEHSVAIVMPTQTWQAYNFRDDDGDGTPDTWYASGKTARLARPFLNRGVPPHYKYYDAPFLRWALQTHHEADYLSDADLNAVPNGGALRRSYRLLIFEGHHEYVTTHEYDIVKHFRDLGGNLAFLSANNFFWKIEKRGDVMTRVAKWRDVGRPEAGLIGVQYYHNDEGEHRGPWIVQKSALRQAWLLQGTDLRIGSAFSSGGVEADDVTLASPANVTVIAKIPNLYGDGRSAEMTYYETSRGAKVFAAGAFTLADAIWEPHVRRLVENLWDRLSTDARPRALASVSTAAAHRRAAPSYGYPVKPFHEQHPIRGFFGDPRIGNHGATRQFHFGVDVSAPNGTPVYATLSGTVSLLHPDVVVISGAGGVQFSYWHIVPTVHDGESAVAYQTVIGHIEKPWAHVHFSEARYGRYLNPLRPGAMGPYEDTTTPTVQSLEVERGARQLARRAVSGSVDLVVETWDDPPMAVPAPWQNLPVMPALIRWRIVGEAGPVTRWSTAVDFRETIPSAGAFSYVFAKWTRQNHAKLPGRYRVYLTHGWNAASVPSGSYRVEVEAVDIRANTAHFVSTIEVVEP